MDLFASEYGWTKDYIYYSVYPEDLVFLQDKIQIRSLERDIQMLQIIRNPHLERDAAQQFANDLLRRYRSLMGIKEETLDRAGLERLREQLKKESKSIRVK